uniref:Uncharacterized protein n=1 Tax=Anguilla anguilla TaxID=7936 RepID=A0A0E9SHW2_ANGAN
MLQRKIIQTFFSLRNVWPVKLVAE